MTETKPVSVTDGVEERAQQVAGAFREFVRLARPARAKQEARSKLPSIVRDLNQSAEQARERYVVVQLAYTYAELCDVLANLSDRLMKAPSDAEQARADATRDVEHALYPLSRYIDLQEPKGWRRELLSKVDAKYAPEPDSVAKVVAPAFKELLVGMKDPPDWSRVTDTARVVRGLEGKPGSATSSLERIDDLIPSSAREAILLVFEAYPLPEEVKVAVLDALDAAVHQFLSQRRKETTP